MAGLPAFCSGSIGLIGAGTGGAFGSDIEEGSDKKLARQFIPIAATSSNLVTEIRRRALPSRSLM